MFLSNKSYIILRPKVKSDLITEFDSCLIQLNRILASQQLDSDSIIKQTIFINAKNNIEYQQQQNSLQGRLQTFYTSTAPPTSFVAQPPENQQKCVIELVLAKSDFPDLEIQRKKIDNIPYSVVNYCHTKEVYAGGLTVTLKSCDTLECARKSFDIMERILKKENLTFADVVRQWNYVEGILEKKYTPGGLRQNYQIFNDVRTIYYSKCDFTRGYPAATGIGMSAGGIVLEFIAVKNTQKVRTIPIKNPRQVNAYSYSSEVLVGKPINDISQKTSPKFERAKFVTVNNVGQIYISGTAAILGQDSVSDLNARIQTETTIENIQKLISKANLETHNIHANADRLRLSHLRVYVKGEQYLGEVKDVCKKRYPNVPIVYLMSDICRDDLLVELEGVVDGC